MQLLAHEVACVLSSECASSMSVRATSFDANWGWLC